MEPDEMTWVDSVPVRPTRPKRITISEFEWSRAAQAAGELILTARFWINSTELVAILVEDTTPPYEAGTGQATGVPQPRLRLAGRSYLLSVEAPA